LKLILLVNVQDVGVWIVFICTRVGTIGRLFEHNSVRRGQFAEEQGDCPFLKDSARPS